MQSPLHVLRHIFAQARHSHIAHDSAVQLANFYFSVISVVAALAFIAGPFVFVQKLVGTLLAGFFLLLALVSRKLTKQGRPELAMNAFAILMLIIVCAYLGFSQRIGVAALILVSLLPIYGAICGFDNALRLSIAFIAFATALVTLVNSGVPIPNLFPGNRQTGDLMVAVFAILVALVPAAVMLGNLTDALKNADDELTTRRHIEASLLETTQRLADFSATTADRFWETNAEHELTYLASGNDSSDQTLNNTRKHWNPLTITDPDAPPEWKRMNEIFELKQAFRGLEVPAFTSQRGTRWLSLSGRPIFDGQRFVGFRGTTTDITERKQIEFAVAKARDAAERSDRAKSQFLANLSHEMRTPLNGILGMASLLEVSDPTPEQQAWLAELNTCARDLQTMIDRIIDFANVEAGLARLANDPFMLQETVASALRYAGPAAGKKTLTLEHGIDPALPECLEGDGKRLLQILRELLDNAIRFTDSGRVSLQVRLGEPAADQVWLTAEVSDTGCGIADRQQEMIFEAFTQVDGSATRRIGGHGLGLAICRSLAQLMGGSLSLHSVQGQGSTFSVRIPFKRAEFTA